MKFHSLAPQYWWDDRKFTFLTVYSWRKVNFTRTIHAKRLDVKDVAHNDDLTSWRIALELSDILSNSSIQHTIPNTPHARDSKQKLANTAQAHRYSTRSRQRAEVREKDTRSRVQQTLAAASRNSRMQQKLASTSRSPWSPWSPMKPMKPGRGSTIFKMPKAQIIRVTISESAINRL